jgi:resuscitation-promoting factor RpfB
MSPRSQSSRPLRRVRRAISLGLVGLLALPLIAWSNRVDVVVDGELLGLRTYAPTVGDVLDQLELDVGPADEITPSPATAVSDGLTIDVARAINVFVYLDGRLVRVEAPVESVAEALVAADLGDLRQQGAQIDPRWSAPVEDGDVVHVNLPRTVELTVDGATREVETLAETVEDLLDEENVDLDDKDLILPVVGAAIEPDTHVVIQRVGHDEIVEEVALPHEEVRRETDDLRKGTTRVDSEGRDGVRFDTYRLTLVDGEETERELVSREVVREPSPRVVLVGTAPPPPPPPPPAPKPAASTSNVWDRLARCEAGGNWAMNSGNGYHGGLQFHPDTWNRHKPSGYPTYAYQASREQQIVVGERVQRSQGWAAWPACSRKLGLR